MLKTGELAKLIGKNIKAKRIEKNISIKELSYKTNIKESYLKRIEACRAKRLTIIHIYKIATALNIKTSML